MVKGGYSMQLIIRDGASIDYSDQLMLTIALDQISTKAEIHPKTLTQPTVEVSQPLTIPMLIIKTIDQYTLLKFLINQHFI